MTSSLLLKGLAGVAAVGGTVGGLAVYRKEIFGWGKGPEEPKSEDVSGFSHKELIDKVGLSCGLEGNDLTDNTPKDCTVKTEGTIKVKVGDKEEEGVTFTNSGSTKLKVSKSDEAVDGREKYAKKLKFVVDSGDISLTKKDGNSSPTNIQKLEQFETYEVFLRDKKFYLRRKTDSKEEKIKALGLPSGKGKCSLPESGDSNCTLTIEEAKKINFENQTGGVTVSTGTVGLKISKMSDSTDFTDGYRFTFTFPQEVTIGSKNIKTNIPYDFKIKKGAGNALSLEKAWTDDNVFTKKAGLDCSGNNKECSIPSGSNLNVKVGDSKKEGITSLNGGGNGKIKMETDQQGYNQGLKFTITTADVTLSGGNKVGSSSSDISKLEEYETYEIKEEGGKYYLSRKHEAIVFLKKALGLDFCDKKTFGKIYTCDITDVTDLKKINFEGKESHTSKWPSGNIDVQLSIERETSPATGLKFTFIDNADTSTLCLPDGKGGGVKPKDSSGGVEYQIKKGSTDGSICLAPKTNGAGGSSTTCNK